MAENPNPIRVGGSSTLHFFIPSDFQSLPRRCRGVTSR
jgi:hypothetical protein